MEGERFSPMSPEARLAGVRSLVENYLALRRRVKYTADDASRGVVVLEDGSKCTAGELISSLKEIDTEAHHAVATVAARGLTLHEVAPKHRETAELGLNLLANKVAVVALPQGFISSDNLSVIQELSYAESEYAAAIEPSDDDSYAHGRRAVRADPGTTDSKHTSVGIAPEAVLFENHNEDGYGVVATGRTGAPVGRPRRGVNSLKTVGELESRVGLTIDVLRQAQGPGRPTAEKRTLREATAGTVRDMRAEGFSRKALADALEVKPETISRMCAATAEERRAA